MSDVREVTFYGGSDDLVEVEGCSGADEFNVPRGGWSGILSASEGQMAVHLDYRSPGVWSVGVSQVDEGDPIPCWEVRFDNQHRYSVRLSVDCPPDVSLEVVNR